jgi:DNA-binding MarR family transcriptional regulator
MKEKIAESLHKLMHNYRQHIREAAAKSAISIPVTHIRSLKCIRKIRHCSAKDIADKLSLDKSQITRVLKELVNLGYVVKVRDPNNHRSQLLNLTESGDALLDKLMMLDQSAVEKMTHNLTEQQIVDFIHLAEMMTNNAHPSPCSKQA